MSENSCRPPGSGGPPPQVRAEVEAMLARFRAELLGGRGPGASQAELDRNTTHRPTVGSQSTAVTREELHIRTMRERGADAGRIRREQQWARARATPPAVGAPGPAPRSRRILRVTALLAAAAGCCAVRRLVARRQRRDADRSR